MFCVSPRGDDRGDDIVRRCISGLSPGACLRLWLMAANVFAWILVILAIRAFFR
jgi:hypothetical protein